MTTPTFLEMPLHFTIDEFAKYLGGLPAGGWRPEFPTLHNTGVPSLKQWEAMGNTPQERWGASLNRYYKNLGWHAGPHLVVCPAYIWVLCDLTKPGVSVSCWNGETIGIEMVGNYEIGGDDFTSGDGAKERDNAAAVLAILNDKFVWGDLSEFTLGARGLHFHHDCAADHHACPGSKVTKPDMLARTVKAARPWPLIKTPVLLSNEALSADHKTAPAILSVDDIQAALNALHVLPIEPVDGLVGPITIERVKAFQEAHGCFVDGWVGAETSAAIVEALGH